jgi:hypothetical protein
MPSLRPTRSDVSIAEPHHLAGPAQKEH